MTTLPLVTPVAPSSRRLPWLLRLKKRLVPYSLFGRTLLIIVLPTLITLSAATYVFFDRHWYTITNRLTYAVAGDIAMIMDLLEHSPGPDATAGLVRLAAGTMDVFVSFTPGAVLPPPRPDKLNPLYNLMDHALETKLRYAYVIELHHGAETVGVLVGADDGVYTMLFPRRRIYSPTTEVFLIWMTGSSILLSVIALLFMRNQIRPVRRLAQAAEAIGRGREVPWFKLEGAAEVRQAAAALMVMRDRLKRQITQRTAMLAGVSHDLRTPLTRMRLQLALMPGVDGVADLAADVKEMEGMLDAYLAFARGEEAEAATLVDLAELLNEIVQSARRQGGLITLTARDAVILPLRRVAMKRCLVNLTGNALRYAQQTQIGINRREHAVDIVIDDDGPGIASDRREDVFRPFTRIEESRNAATGGVGLGLTIARDIARFHGGDVVLEDSPLGGLRARVWLPV